MELELKHLAPYLPYGLKVKSKKHFYKYGEETILQVNGIAFQDIAETPYWQYEFIYDNDLVFSDINEKQFKPILRPLSDLTKEIEVNVEKFVPLEKINLHECKFFHTTHLVNKSGYDFDINKIPYNSFIKLLEWHFDVFGLIEKGKAVDINTLNK